MNRKIIFIIIIVFTILAVLLAIFSEPNYNFNKVTISEDEWSSIVNSRNESEELSLKSIKFNDYELIIDDKNSTLYYSVINNSATKYSPGISYKASKNGVNLVILEDEITDDKVMNNHAFKVMIYNKNEYRIYDLYCTSIPVLNIKGNFDAENTAFNVPMEIYLFDNLNSNPSRINRSSGNISIMKNESGDFVYSFSLYTTSPGRNERDNIISFFNMKPHNEYFLNAINTEENIELPEGIEKNINESIEEGIKDDINENVEESSKENGKPDSNFRKEVMSQPVELFINNEYIGLYSLSYNTGKEPRPIKR